MKHHATGAHARRICDEQGVPWEAVDVWKRLEVNDLLACAFARLLLYSDPLALPVPGDYEAGWDLYAERAWRPGKPHRDTWNENHDNARAALGV